MTTTELIKLLQSIEKGASGRSREISFKIGDDFIFEPIIKISGTGDGCCGAEVNLEIIEKKKPIACGKCRFYSSTPYVCHNERGYQANCAMGYMKDRDTRGWDMTSTLFSGCKLGE